VLRSLQVRAVLFPLAVAAVLVAALGFYRFVKIPAQQQYLNERNARILQTIALQIVAKVDSFDGSIDNAIDFWYRDSSGSPSAPQADTLRYDRFADYVKTFSPDLTLVGQDEPKVVRNPGDPPRVRIKRDEGRNYLFVGYKHGGKRDIFAKVDIEEVVKPYLEGRGEFDALVLAQASGRAIAQYAKSEFRLEHVDLVDFRASGSSTAQVQKPALTNVSSSGKVASVRIGEVEYRFYAQPVVLSLETDPDKKEDATGPSQPEEWVLCGFVRADRFGAASVALPPRDWLLFVDALLVIALGIPILKLHVLNPRERFERGDCAWVIATAVLLAGLICANVLDVYYFGYRLAGWTDNQLKRVAESINNHLRDELAEAHDQLDAFRTVLQGSTWKRPGIVIQSENSVCDPSNACNSGILERDWARDVRIKYPYFDIISGTGSTGEQLVKWTTSPIVTPFINIRDAGVPYFEDLDRANLESPPQSDGQPVSVGLSVHRSPNTGNKLTVIWEALGAKRGEVAARPDDRKTDEGVTGASLTMTAPVSVLRPVLPRRTQFAVLDSKGVVIYHSDPVRSLNENFVEESEGNADLRAAIEGRQSVPISTAYLGRRQRLFVMPVDLGSTDAKAETPIINDPRWFLAVFQPVDVLDTVNLETLLLTGVLFVSYCAVLAIAWGLAILIAPGRPRRWFWPDPDKASAYRLVAFLNLGLIVGFFLVVVRLPPDLLVPATIVLSTIGVVMTFLCVTRPTVRRGERPKYPEWRRDFFLAHLAFLLVVAALPVFGFFRSALTLETDLLVRRSQLAADEALSRRREEIGEDVQKIGLCQSSSEPPHCVTPADFLARRVNDSRDIDLVGMSVDPSASPSATAPVVGWLDSVLAVVHLPLNDEAADLRAALLADASPVLHPRLDDPQPILRGTDGAITSVRPGDVNGSGDWVARGFVGLATTLGLGLLLRYGMMPMFLLDLFPRPAPQGSGQSTDGNVVFVGLPRTGKTARLRSVANLQVYDVRTDALDAAPLEPQRTVVLDHFEHGLDSATRRQPLLEFLERLIYLEHRQVWIATTRDPLEHVHERAAADLDRWIAVLRSFRKVVICLDADPSSRTHPTQHIGGGEQADRDASVQGNDHRPAPQLPSEGDTFEMGASRLISPIESGGMLNAASADPYYQALWVACSKDERLALRQLAEEGAVNPRNGQVLERLMLSGLIRRDPTFHLLSAPFRRFVLRAVPAEEVKAWEHDGVVIPWSSYFISAATVVVSLGAVLILTQEQLLDTWISYVPALVPTVTGVSKWLAAVRPPSSRAAST
jgi:hypothetical protein